MNLGWLQRAACVVCELLQSQLRLLKGISHLLIKNPISDEISPNSWATSMKCQCHPKMVCLLLKEISSSWETWSLNSLMILWWEEYCDEKVEGPTLKFRPPPRQPIAKWRRRFTMREVPLQLYSTFFCVSVEHNYCSRLSTKLTRTRSFFWVIWGFEPQ